MNLFPHQVEALEATKDLNRVGYFLDMGLGKTFVGSEKMVSFSCKVNLILCQKSKVQGWLAHFTTIYIFQVYDLTVPKEFRTFFGVSQGGKYPCVGVINYELAWRRKDLLLLTDFTLMLDESSYICNKSAKRTKFILKLKPQNVILLSGTLCSGKYENLWTQLHLMGWDISEKLYEKQYVNWKTIEAGGMVHKIVDKDDPYKNIDRLKRKMREHGAVFKKTEECFQLPEQTFTKVMIKPIKEYRTFQKDCIVNIDGYEVIGDTTLTKLLFSRQLCGHFNKDKLEAFRDLVESTQDRLIVFYSFNAELEALKKICHDLGRPTSEINGHCKDLTAYEEESNSVTICQYQSASKGLNLQKCNRIIYFTLPLSSEDFEQSKKRIHRIGQEKPCFYYLMICRNTVEEQILQALEARRDFTDELFKERNAENEMSNCN